MAKSGKSAGGDSEQVICIRLTPEQQQQINRESGGKLNIKEFRLRPNLDLGITLDKSGRVVGAGGVKTTFAPPPQGSYWV